MEKARKKTFVTVFPFFSNELLIKDVGAIPYMMYKQYGYESYIATYTACKADDLPYLNTETPGLKLMNTIRKFPWRSSTWDVFVWLLFNARKIDVLNIYHLVYFRYCWIWLYKFLNPNGKIYLKLDIPKTEPAEIMKEVGRSRKNKRKIMERCTVVSAEHHSVSKQLESFFGRKVLTVPNGVDRVPENVSEERENAFLTVGRLGLWDKASDTLLEAFALSGVAPEWKLILVGGFEPGFKEVLDTFMNRHPELKDSVVVAGKVMDRYELSMYYQKAKCFLLPSRREGCATVIGEAAVNGCFQILSEIASREEVLGEGRYGSVVPVDDAQALADAMRRVSNEEVLFSGIHGEIAANARENLVWASLLKPVAKELQ